MDDAAVSGAPLNPPRSWKSALPAVGFVLGLLAVGFVMLRLRAYAGQIELSQLSQGTCIALGGLALSSGLANALLGLAWWRLLRLTGIAVPPLWAIRAHGISQLARYVPGNVFQFAGRQAMGVAAGLPGKPLAVSVAWELGSLATVGALMAVVAAPLLLPASPPWLAVPAMLAALWLAHARFGRPLVDAMLLHLVFLALYGSLFVTVLALVQAQPFDWHTAPTICGAFILAWLVGLVTPGAPAGGGIREAVLLLLLGHRFGQADLLLAIVLGRLINVLGDVGFFALASFLPKTEPRHAVV